jgi:chemotaxis regulatin CheY-phosphate phosphatase CheZ
MKHGGLTDGAGQLKMAGDKLEEAWELARADWNDVVSRSMEEEQIEPLLQQLRATLVAVSRTSIVLTTACRECEDERTN